MALDVMQEEGAVQLEILIDGFCKDDLTSSFTVKQWRINRVKKISWGE